MRKIPLAVIAILAFLYLTKDSGLAQEQEVIAGGELEFQHYCVSCHGAEGKGGGTMARFLTVKPSNLTQLSKNNGGEFPFWRLYRIIEGRERVKGHGSTEMPVWGARFRAEAEGVRVPVPR
jgi:mono/diheme cytochrome c family protein